MRVTTSTLLLLPALLLLIAIQDDGGGPKLLLANAAPVEFTTSVLLVGMRDFRASKCKSLLSGSTRLPQSAIHFIITAFWYDKEDDRIPEHFCYNRGLVSSD